MTIESVPKQKVLVVDDFHPILTSGLKANQYHIDYEPGLKRDAILEKINQYEGLIVRSKINCNQTFFEKAQNLKWIARGGAGMDNIDVNLANSLHIKLLNAPEGNRNAVAEHCMGLMLGLSNKLPLGFEGIKQKKWQRESNRGFELAGKTLAIIGYGNIGQNLAQKAKAFDMKVIAYDPYNPIITNQLHILTSMEQVFNECDWLSLNIPLTKQTKNLVNGAFLSQFKKQIGIINTSRGAIVETHAIWSNLVNGRIFAFGADVIENESPDKWSLTETEHYLKLAQFPQVLLSPHVAGWSVESYQKIAEVLLQKILDYAAFSSL